MLCNSTQLLLFGDKSHVMVFTGTVPVAIFGVVLAQCQVTLYGVAVAPYLYRYLATFCCVGRVPS